MPPSTTPMSGAPSAASSCAAIVAVLAQLGDQHARLPPEALGQHSRALAQLLPVVVAFELLLVHAPHSMAHRRVAAKHDGQRLGDLAQCGPRAHGGHGAWDQVAASARDLGQLGQEARHLGGVPTAFDLVQPRRLQLSDAR
jgi:hypothetical protein